MLYHNNILIIKKILKIVLADWLLKDELKAIK